LFEDDIKEVIDYVDKHLDIYLDPRFTYNEQVKQDVIAKVKKFYFNGKTMDENALTETINVRFNDIPYDFLPPHVELRVSFSLSLYPVSTDHG
jgi:hypothetical protein